MDRFPDRLSEKQALPDRGCGRRDLPLRRRAGEGIEIRRRKTLPIGEGRTSNRFQLERAAVENLWPQINQDAGNAAGSRITGD